MQILCITIIFEPDRGLWSFSTKEPSTAEKSSSMATDIKIAEAKA